MGQSTITLYQIITQCLAIIMFGKLSQIKNFISNAVTSISSQRPTPPYDAQLQRKLKFLLDYILRNPTGDQFKAYHSLQSPELTLNELLKQIYHSEQADTAQIASILHFFTFLLINCNNQLVLCKIVSDSFVIELTEVQLDALGEGLSNPNVEIEEVNSYKIALIKAYVSRINQETIKYMVIKDRMKIFQNCVALYQEYMRVEEEQQFGVEATCISNCILLIVKYLAANPEHAPNISYQEGKKGIVYLLVRMVENVHQSMKSILNSSDLEEQPFQMLKDKILFLVDIFNSISSQEIRTKIISETSRELTDLRDLFKEIVIQHTAVFSQSQQNYIKSLELIKVLLKLLAIYYNAEQLLPLFSECLLPLLHKFMHVFKSGCKAMVEELINLKHERAEHELSQRQVQSCIVHKQKLVYIFCANMQIVASIMRSGQYLMRRNTSQLQQRELKAVIINILVDVIQLLLGEEGESIKELLCYKSIKFLLLSLMQVTLENEHTMHQYSVIKFHQFAIQKFRRELKNNQLWDALVLNYESYLRMINQNLLSIEDASPNQYAYCQFHDPGKIKVPLPVEMLTNAIFINECARNFRFMIVENSSVSSKDIKLQKNYHNNFITPGWGYEPGKQISETISEICHLSHLSKGIKIPISVLEDDDCLLFAHSEGQTKKILLNIRFKSIQGFIGEKDTLVIKLKGLQEVLVEAVTKKQREDIKVFKEYLIQKRDKSRERELKFIHHYLDIYYKDNRDIIERMGQAEIQSDSDIAATESIEVSQEKPSQLLEGEGKTSEQAESAEGLEAAVAEVVDDQ